MLETLLPLDLVSMIKERFNIRGIYEIKIRCDMPLVVCYFGDFVFLRDSNRQLIYADKRLIEYVVSHATDSSLYRYNNQIKNGFISVSGGIRIGVAGEVVEEENRQIKTIKNFSSLNIRIPHEIKGCATEIMKYILDSSGINNTLIISPPGCGKTTYLRDVARQLSQQEQFYNVLIIDERYEICAVENCRPRLDVGNTTDIISGSTKEYGLIEGLRTLRPDVVITDELSSIKDIRAIKLARTSGVKVIASVHAYNHLDLKNKLHFRDLIESRSFDRYVILSRRNGVGTCEMILNSSLEPLFSL